jgi:hypothetical protein
MRGTWRIERAVGAGRWFVALQRSRISVLAPPGVRLHHNDRWRELHHGVAGWRRATWPVHRGESLPVIDRDPPELVRPLTTRTALRLLPEGFHDLVWQMLYAQLLSARAFGRPVTGRLALEELARAGATTALWLESELRAAFPHRVDELDRDLRAPAMLLDEVPDTPEQLLAGACRHRPHQQEERVRRPAKRPYSHATGRQPGVCSASHVDVFDDYALNDQLFYDEDLLAAAIDSVQLT